MVDKWNDEFNKEKVKTCRFYNPNLTLDRENFDLTFNNELSANSIKNCLNFK